MRISSNDKIKLQGFQKMHFPFKNTECNDFESSYLDLGIDAYLKGYVSQALSFFNRKIKVLEGYENIFLSDKKIDKFIQIANTLSKQDRDYAMEYLNKAKEIVEILNRCRLKVKPLNIRKLEKLNDLVKLYDTTSFGFIGFHDDVLTKADIEGENLIIEIKSMDKIVSKIIFYNISNLIKDICSFVHYTNIFRTKNGRLKVVFYGSHLELECDDFELLQTKKKEASKCPCCGCYTGVDDFGDICPVCFWEIDENDADDFDFISEMNHNLSLKQARKNFLICGAIKKVLVKYTRLPTSKELKEIIFNHVLIEFRFESNIRRNIGRNYMPHLVVEKDKEYLGIRFYDDFKISNDVITAKVKCLYTGVNYLKLKPQVAFRIMEGGTTIGYGKVLDIIDSNSEGEFIIEENNKNLKNHYKSNFMPIRNIINEWDPMNLFDGEEDDLHIDEYDPEITDIITKLKLATEKTLANDIKDIFMRWFGLENCNISMEECLTIAKKILESIDHDSKL